MANEIKSNGYLAAIDLGTNSFHIVVVEVLKNGSFVPVAREKESVRIGSGAGEVENISDDAMERGISCLRRFKTLAESKNATIRAIGTSALREAGNSYVFQNRVRNEVGINIEVISGYEEARLIYFGILQGLPVFGKKIIMIDIGGGSTEVLVGEKGEVLFSQSFKLGAIRLTDRFFRKSRITDIDIQECRYYIENMILPFRDIILDLNPEICIGSSGTVNAIAEMIRKTDSSMNGYSYSLVDLRKIRLTLVVADTLKKKEKLNGIDVKRADIILAGTLILEEVMSILDQKSIQVSDFALREGIIFDTISKMRQNKVNIALDIDTIRTKSINHLIETFRIDKKHALHVKNLSIQLFDQLKELHQLPNDFRVYLEAAAMLHEAGMIISHSAHHHHTYYIISNSEKLLGFNNNELQLIAIIARYHRKGLPKQKHIEYSSLTRRDQIIIRKLAALLRIADGLDRNHLSSIDHLICNISEEKVKIDVYPKNDILPDMEVWSANTKQDLFEEVYQIPVEFTIVSADKKGLRENQIFSKFF